MKCSRRNTEEEIQQKKYRRRNAEEKQ